MSSRLARRVTTAALALATVAGAVVATAPDAAAATVFRPASRAVVGDLTGDGIADRTTLGTFRNGTVCAYQIERGRGGGRYAAPVSARLPVENHVPDGGVFACPSLAVVLVAPTPAQNQLAVTWFDFPPYDAPSVQIFRGFGSGVVRNSGGFAGPFQPAFLGSKDFDGDGWGDLYTTTDQRTGSTFWVGRNRDWRLLYATPEGSTDTRPQFFDLNHNGGTDILAVSDTFGLGTQTAAVDGRSGAVQVLTSIPDPYSDQVRFTLSVTDENHDALPDLLVTTQRTDAQDVTTTTFQRFLNRSGGGRWYFAPQTTTGG